MKNHKLSLLLVNAFLVVNILIYILIPFVNVSFVKNPVTISIYCVGLAGMAILEIFLSKEYKRIPADKETEKEVKIKELQVEEEYISYAKQSEFVEKSRKIRHDFNNILQITNSLSRKPDKNTEVHIMNILDELSAEIEDIQKGCDPDV